MDRIKVASLFCGLGGSDLGILGGFTYLRKKYSTNNAEVVFANDIDNSAAEIFEKNFSTKVDRRDIRTIKSSEIPNIDVLVAGFPCQSFSIIAQNPPRLGYKEENGKLFFEISRLLKSKKPKCFIAENVKGILTANGGKAFPLILNEFKNCGYTVNFKVLKAINYGIPQKRERVFIIGFRNDLKVSPRFPKPSLNNNRFIPLKKVISDENKIEEKYYFSEKAINGMLKRKEKMNLGRVQDINSPCNTISAHLAKVSLNSTDPVLKLNDRYRRFTPREAANIQSFPKSFKLINSEFQQYKAIGNAIPPVLMWYVFSTIAEQLNGV